MTQTSEGDHAGAEPGAPGRRQPGHAGRPRLSPTAVVDASTTSLRRLAATVERLQRQVLEVTAAADGRALVELAKGILVERLRCGPTEAGRQLADLAEQAGVSVLELSVDIINQAAHDSVAEATDAFLAQTRGADEAGRAAAVRLRSAESATVSGDAHAAARGMLEHALEPLGATAVAIWIAGPDASLTLAGFGGISAEEAARWHYVPPGVATAARHALSERRAVWFENLAAAGLPSIAAQHAPNGGRVAVPAGTGGRIVGVLEICWPQPLAPQPPQIHRQVEALAELCAHTLETGVVSSPPPPRTDVSELVDLADSLNDPALVLRPQLDSDGRVADFRIHHANPRYVDPSGRPRSAIIGAFLLEAYPIAAAVSGLSEKVERVHATGEPFRTDQMAITSQVDQVRLTTVAGISISRHGDGVLLIWRVEDEAARLANLLQHAQRLGRIGGFEEIAGTGEVIWSSQLFHLYGLPASAPPVPLDQIGAYAHPDDEAAVRRFLRTVLHQRRPGATAFRLRRSDGVPRHIRVVAEPVLDTEGHLVAIRGAYQDVSAQHWTEVALAATREQLAHTALESAERSRLALQLQHAIMPPTQGTMDVFGLEVAVRYRPAEKDHLVGGDWYDVVVLPSQQILLCVGDVAGHGIEAATGMVVLRNALRGLAATGAGPAQILGWLNIVAHHLTDKVTATAVVCLYDPQRHSLRWGRAGHLPPVVLRAGSAETLPLINGLLLGAIADAGYEEGEVSLDVGDTLLLYTDGLIERRGRLLEDSVDRLTNVAGQDAADLGERLDSLLAQCSSDTDDDTCVVGIRIR